MANNVKEAHATRIRGYSDIYGRDCQEYEATATDIIPDLDEYYTNRVGDLAGGQPVSYRLILPVNLLTVHAGSGCRKKA